MKTLKIINNNTNLIVNNTNICSDKFYSYGFMSNFYNHDEKDFLSKVSV